MTISNLQPYICLQEEEEKEMTLALNNSARVDVP